MSSFTDKDKHAVDNIRCLCADVVQGANSGHPGAPMGMAPMAHVVWTRHLRFSSANSSWIGRDRFVLSNGHACALLYSMLHLNGFKVTLDDLKNFRQLGSVTPGHPESADTDGVEVTTGPLGQGISNAVGMAIAESHLAARYNKVDSPTLFDNYVYVLCGDGCLQEGVSAEAASLAGHLGLGRIIVLYDDNDITIDGSTSLSFSEDVLKRFEAYGWHTSSVADGDADLDAIDKAITAAKAVTDKPSIIAVKTTIGFASKMQATAKVHGSPLGDEDIANVKTKLGFDPAKKYDISATTRGIYDARQKEGLAEEKKWNERFEAYRKTHSVDAAEIERRFEGKLTADWNAGVPSFTPQDKAEATRSSSGAVLNAFADALVEIVGGSADLSPSNKTELKCSHNYTSETRDGRYLRFGVREHGMAAICNGIAAYGGFIPFAATFLNFIEYCFPAVRLSAVSHLRVLYIMTHDSIGLGEDGPTHQPIEALSLCRATPNLYTFRPADGNEVVGSYMSALQFANSPSVFALSRQNLPNLEGSSAGAVSQGAYTLVDFKEPDVILIGTGSEVELCVAAAAKLAPKKVRVVSMPCWELFDEQPVAYRREVIKPGVPVVSVEVLSVTGWERYAHHSLGLHSYGKSAPSEQIYDFFGFTPDKIAKSVNDYIDKAAEASKELGGVAAHGLLPVHF